MHGWGTYTSADGSMYSGKYKNGKYYQGATLHADGSKYVGTYKDEKFDGDIDTIIDEYFFGGPKYIGQWRVDNPLNGTEYDKDGNVTATCDPPPLNWSTRYDSSGRTDNEYQTT